MAESFSRKFVLGIDANRTVKDELAAAVGRQRARRRISVTDLVNPRQAFFRWTHPEIRPSAERTQVLLSGTGFHELFGRAVSTEEFVEQFVEFEGIVGKIDIYEDVPMELKTTALIPDDLQASRPGYIDQLGMYCAMTGKSNGRLLVYKRARYGRDPVLRTFDAEYADLPAIVTEMRRRRDLFDEALKSGDASALPRCEWFDLGCDYKDICSCESAKPLGRVAPPGTVTLEENTGLSAVLGAQVGTDERQPVEDKEAAEEVEVETQLAQLEREGFRGALFHAIHFGIPGAFSRIPVELRSINGLVSAYKGVPTLLRSTKTRSMVERERLPEMFSHYFDRLALECALSGHERGRFVVYYEAVSGDKFMVYDVYFRGLEEIIAEANRRLERPQVPPWL